MAAFVVHVLGAAGSEFEPSRADRGFLWIVHDDVPRLAVGHPVGKRGDHIDPVVPLRFAEADVILEAGVGAHGALAIVVVPAVAIGAGGPPSVARNQEGRAVGELEGVPVGGGAEKSAAERVLPLLIIAPRNGSEGTALAGESRIFGTRSAGPVPLARFGGDHPHAELIATISEAIHALF